MSYTTHAPRLPTLSFSVFLVVACALLLACASGTRSQRGQAPDPEDPLDGVAERYVRLVLGVGLHDDSYVDAYYGPESWREEVAAESPDLETLAAEATDLVARVEEVELPPESEELLLLRQEYLKGQLDAVAAYVRILRGKEMSFDEESRALYDAVSPHHEREQFEAILDRLEELVPGKGPLADRYHAWRRDFVIPEDRLDTVFQAAIEEARARTLEHVDLPRGESFVVEYVTDKPWSGYNWYQGDGFSLIQINTDLPIYVERAVDLAAHEGYPGHHVYNASLEKELVDERGWVELSVYALFSPQSLIAEGSANFGKEVAFPADQRLAFEMETIFPLAGIAPERAERYYQIQDLVEELSYAGNEAARRYLNGEIDGEEAAEWLQTYLLSEEDRARQRVRFFDTYRSYVINYNWGQDLVRRYVEALGGTADDPDRRWEVFATLLASPRLPSALEETIAEENP